MRKDESPPVVTQIEKLDSPPETIKSIFFNFGDIVCLEIEFPKSVHVLQCCRWYLSDLVVAHF